MHAGLLHCTVPQPHAAAAMLAEGLGFAVQVGAAACVPGIRFYAHHVCGGGASLLFEVARAVASEAVCCFVDCFCSDQAIVTMA